MKALAGALRHLPEVYHVYLNHNHITELGASILIPSF